MLFNKLFIRPVSCNGDLVIYFCRNTLKRILWVSTFNIEYCFLSMWKLTWGTGQWTFMPKNVNHTR